MKDPNEGTVAPAAGPLTDGERQWMRDYEKSLNRRVTVEKDLLDIANGKLPLPTDREQFRKWASKLGVPVEWLAGRPA